MKVKSSKMGITDYISSTANSVNQNAIKPVYSFCSSIVTSSYSYSCAAATNVGEAIGVGAASHNEDDQRKHQQFAAIFAKNAALFAVREGLRSLPGGGPIYDIASRSVSENNKKMENHRREELKALKSELKDHKNKVKELQAVIDRMERGQNNPKQALNQAEVDEPCIDVELESRKCEAYRNQEAAIRTLMIKGLHSNVNNQPPDYLREILTKGLVSIHLLHDLNKSKKCPESSA